MKSDEIEEIGIDDKGSIYVRPRESQFPYMYREAMEVGWDPERRCLFSPKPREWTYTMWFHQLLAGAKEQGVALRISRDTAWTNIPAELRTEIES